MAQKPKVWFVDDLPRNRKAFRTHHKDHFAITLFSKPGAVLKRIRNREYPDALLCDVFFYETVSEADRIEKQIERLAKELKKKASAMDLYDHKHATGIELMRRVYEHFQQQGEPRPPFPIYAYTSKGPFLLEQREWKKISSYGAQVLLKNRVMPDVERMEIEGDIQTASRNLNRVFIAHGKQKPIVGQIKSLLRSRKFEPVVSVERETTAIPVPKKVFEDMRSCGAGVAHIGAEGKYRDAAGNERAKLNDNVLIEIGAAMALYGKKVILVVERGVRLPSNLQGLYRCNLNGDRLDRTSETKLRKTLKQFCQEGWAARRSMPLYWLCYRHNNQISVVIQPGASIVHARMRAALARLDEGSFAEGHELDGKTEKQVPKAMIGRRLSQEEAKRLLAKFSQSSMNSGGEEDEQVKLAIVDEVIE